VLPALFITAAKPAGYRPANTHGAPSLLNKTATLTSHPKTRVCMINSEKLSVYYDVQQPEQGLG
jgi:hypothetical protein